MEVRGFFRFMASPGQPKITIKTPPVLFERTQPLLLRVAEKVGMPVITYWNAPSGSICSNDVVGMYGVLRELPPAPEIALFIKSDGGNGQASLRIVNLLRQFSNRLLALVPLECQSAATMLALGADEIHMGPLAHLSAVDTSLTHDLSPIDRDNDRVSVSQDELYRVIRLWRQEAKGSNLSNPYQALFQHVHPLVVGAVDRASALSTKLCHEILSYHMKDAKKSQRISQTLNSSYPSHSYPITQREAKRIGLNVKQLDQETNALLLELNEVYSEMGQRAITDFDEHRQHDNGILNILEGSGIQIIYQNDKDWIYRKEERRWVSMNDKSCWKRVVMVKGKPSISVLHVR